MNKYYVGRCFKNFNELFKWCWLEHKSVYFHNHCYNWAFICSQQLSFLTTRWNYIKKAEIRPDIRSGDKILISAEYLWREEGFTTKGGKKQWYMVEVSQVFGNYFTFSGHDMKYIHEIPFINEDFRNHKKLYKIIKNKREK